MDFRTIVALVDANSDGALSLEEVEAASVRIFKAADADADGRLTTEEIDAFISGGIGVGVKRRMPRLSRHSFLHNIGPYAASGRRCHTLKQVLVTQHQSGVVHHEIGLKSARQAKVDIAHPARSLPVIALARPGDRQRRPVDEGGVEGQARSRALRRPTDREGVAEGRDRQVWLLRAVEVRARRAIDPPAASSAFQAKDTPALRVPAFNSD